MGGAVTRPAGTTPNGLPYPGSADIHANTPAALQALAMAVDDRLSALEPGIIIDVYRSGMSVPVSSYFPAQFNFTFPRLAAVNGWVGVYGVDDGGVLADAYIIASNATFGQIAGLPFYIARPPANFTLHAVGWGPPRG